MHAEDTSSTDTLTDHIDGPFFSQSPSAYTHSEPDNNTLWFFPYYPSLWSLSPERKSVLFGVSFSVLPGPDSVAFESRRDLDDVLFSDPDLDLAGVVHHLHGVSVGRLVAGLGHCKQSRAQPSRSLIGCKLYC